MRGVKSNEVIQALSTLEDLERKKERDLFQQLQRRELPSIEGFFSPQHTVSKSRLGVEKELLLYLKVRPRRLKPLSNSARPTPVLSPTPTLDSKTVLTALRKKPRQYQGRLETYSDWDVHCSMQMRRERPNFRFNAIRDMKTLRAYRSPYSTFDALSP